MKRDMTGRKVAVYDLVGDKGVLYVGRTVNPIKRERDHKNERRIRQCFALHVYEWCNNIEEAKRLERARIDELRPPYNTVGNRDKTPTGIKKWNRAKALRLVMQGMDPRDIAYACGVTHGTIRDTFYRELREVERSRKAV